MTARLFRLEIDGQLMVGLAFGSEAELEEFLAGRGLVAPAGAGAVAAPIQPDDPPPVHRGRPSFDARIAQAVEFLGTELDRCTELAGRARLVLKQLARTGDANSIPTRRTVEAYLAQRRPSRKKERNKQRKKSTRGSIAP